MTFIDHENMPRPRMNNRFEMGLMDRPVDTGNNELVGFKACVCILTGNPNPEAKAKTLHFVANIADESSRGEIQNA